MLHFPLALIMPSTCIWAYRANQNLADIWLTMPVAGTTATHKNCLGCGGGLSQNVWAVAMNNRHVHALTSAMA